MAILRNYILGNIFSLSKEEEIKLSSLSSWSINRNLYVAEPFSFSLCSVIINTELPQIAQSADFYQKKRSFLFLGC